MKAGRYGIYGGQYVPETLMSALIELEETYTRVRDDPDFSGRLSWYLHEYAGRETPLTFCENLSRDLGCRVYLKREDLLHGGAHKLNNTLGQGLMAKYMGKRRLIAETGAGQHGVATAIAGAVLGLPVEVYMGEVDTRRQALNVFRMELLGARVIPVTSGTRTLKDAINAAMRDWVANLRDTHYLLGSCVGPRGSRVQAISNELRGEKIDIIRWSEDPEEYLGNALSPAKVVAVEMNENEALVIVPDNQLSLAIGKEGQNARLAAKITGFKIDICSESQIAQERFSSLGLGNNEKKNGAAASGEEEIAGTEGTAPEGTAGEKPLNGGAEEGAESAPEDAADESAPEEAGSDSENV